MAIETVAVGKKSKKINGTAFTPPSPYGTIIKKIVAASLTWFSCYYWDRIDKRTFTILCRAEVF